MEKRTVWTIVIVVAVLALLACCCVGAVLVARSAWFRATPASGWFPAVPAIPEISVIQEAGTIRGSGTVVEREYALGSVDSVRLTTAGDLTIRLGAQPSLLVRGEDNIVELIELQERGGELTISMRPGIRISGRGPLQFTLTVPSLRGITSMGSGDISGPDMVGTSVSIHVSGSGDVRVGRIRAQSSAEISAMGSGDVSAQNVEADSIKVSITGSGSVSIGPGKVNTQELTIMGSGSYSAAELVSARVTATLTGSGSARVQVSDELSARLMGSGDLDYIGSPTLNTTAVGSGRVRQVGR